MICTIIIKTDVQTVLMGITVIVLIECTFSPQFFIGAIEALISIPFWKVSQCYLNSPLPNKKAVQMPHHRSSLGPLGVQNSDHISGNFFPTCSLRARN